MRELVVDLEAIRHNVRTIAALIAPARLLAVVKADAYGHGLVPVARAMAEAGVDAFGVVDLEEARRLRDAGVDAAVLAWIHGADADFDWALTANVELGVGAVETLRRIVGAAERTQRVAVVHLKADSGLGRGGAIGDDWEELVALAATEERAGRIRVHGLWTHLANASDASDAAQFEAFDAAIATARAAGLDPEVEHAAASAAMLAHPDQTRGMVRAGLALYGLSPLPDRTPAELGLRPAMTVAGEVVGVKRVPAGLGVSYGHRYVTPRETTLALVPLGYADGLPRAATGRAPIGIGGRRYPIVGAISMDQVVVDVGDDPVALGDRAVLWGDPTDGVPSAQDWADAAGTISYEIVTRVGGRVRRRYVG